MTEDQQKMPQAEKQTSSANYPEFYTMPALLLDLDGTVRKTISGEPFMKNVTDQQLNADIEKRIWHFRDKGFFIAAVSNQGGVAAGFKSEEDVVKELAYLHSLFERYPFHWHMTALCMESGSVYPFNYRSLLRKPEYGMLAVMEHECFTQRSVVIDWNSSFMVGDRSEDANLAINAGIQYIHIDDFLKLPLFPEDGK